MVTFMIIMITIVIFETMKVIINKNYNDSNECYDDFIDDDRHKRS